MSLQKSLPHYPQLTAIEADAMENIEELMDFGLRNHVPQTFLYHHGTAINLEKPYQLVGLKTPEVVGQVLSHFITT